MKEKEKLEKLVKKGIKIDRNSKSPALKPHNSPTLDIKRMSEWQESELRK
jgi:hypothetical protein